VTAVSATDAAANAAPVVRLAGIGKSFRTGGKQTDRETVALTDITLDIGRGEFVSLIGPSGCGKSTLLRVIGDLTEPTTGSVEVNGKPAGRARLDREYGMVFQAPVLFDWRTIEDNVRLPLELFGYDRQAQNERTQEMLTDFARHRPYQLSGGMQQRVAIARALAFSPSLLLMDEPFGALDEMTRERMNSEVLSIWARTGITVVFVTHSIPEAVFLSSRVAVMSARPGRITRIVDVDLPRPRGLDTRESPAYFSLITEVREALRGSEGAETDVASVERTAAEGVVG
jgi:NitT/TauT family transport system ATP-binding protein